MRMPFERGRTLGLSVLRSTITVGHINALPVILSKRSKATEQRSLTLLLDVLQAGI